MGMGVGHAHLLEDVISLVRFKFIHHLLILMLTLQPIQLEISPDEGPTIIERMTFTYDLGEQHGLYECMRRATVENMD
jgi:m7GpppX diphosphatase